MLLDGINHVAIITDDTDRFVQFYEDVFDATVANRETVGPGTLTFVNIGPRTQLNVFEIGGDERPDLTRGSMFGHGPIDHLGLQAADRPAFVEIRRRLMQRAAADGFISDFGQAHSVFFRDPDGLEGEVVLWVSDDGPINPPGTPATGYDDPPG